MSAIPARWAEKYNAIHPDELTFADACKLVRELGISESALTKAQAQNQSLQQQVDALRATLIAVGRNMGCLLDDSVSTEFLHWLVEESSLLVQRNAYEIHDRLAAQQQVARLTAALRTIQDATQGIPIYRTIYRLTTEALSSPAPEVKVHVGGGQ